MSTAGAGSFVSEVGAELRRLSTPPRAELVVLAVNAVLVTLGWWLLPSAWRDWVIDAVPGPVGFAIVFETWLLSDVTSTNLFGHDPTAVIGALDRDGGIRRLTRVKTAAIAVVVGVPSAMIGVAEALAAGELREGVEFAPLLVVAPFGVVAVTSWFGAALPYRCRTLRWRWTHRRAWRTTARWAVAVTVPLWLGGAVTSVLVVPAVAVGLAATGAERSAAPTVASMRGGLALACVVCGLAYLVATRVTAWLVAQRRGQVTAALSDPHGG